MEHSRLHMGKLNPVVGDTLVTNRRRPILTLVADTSGGVHDTLLAACDRERYELLGCHRAARQLHRQPARGAGDARPRRARDAEPAEPVRERPPRRRRDAGDRPTGVDPRQLGDVPRRVDAVLVFSACPQDIVATNGPGLTPTDAHFRVLT